jgi:hypothetical protein
MEAKATDGDDNGDGGDGDGGVDADNKNNEGAGMTDDSQRSRSRFKLISRAAKKSLWTPAKSKLWKHSLQPTPAS